MIRQSGSVSVFALAAVLALCLGPQTATAADVAWDMVGSTSQNLVDHFTDAPPFGSPGDGFQKYAVGVSPTIPFALVDDSISIYPPDNLGIINSETDFDEFFGVVDTENNENSGPVTATWIFDISSGVANLELSIDLAAMGNFEVGDVDIVPDSFVWSYSVDGAADTPIFMSSVGEGVTITYQMASGTLVDYADPLMVDGETLTNVFLTFTTPIPAGNQLTLTLTCTADGGSEAYVARNIMITDSPFTPTPNPDAGGDPIPTLTPRGMAVMVVVLLGIGLLLIRRQQ